MMMIGYARITRDSDIAARQDHELSALDCDRLYLDQPGGGRRRPGLAAALQSMEFGDCLAVWRLAALKLGAGGLR